MTAVAARALRSVVRKRRLVADRDQGIGRRGPVAGRTRIPVPAADGLSKPPPSVATTGPPRARRLERNDPTAPAESEGATSAEAPSSSASTCDDPPDRRTLRPT